MPENNSLEQASVKSEVPAPLDNVVGKFFQDAYHDGSKYLHDHPAAQAGLAIGGAALALRYHLKNPFEITKVIPAVEGEAVLMQSQRSGLRGLLGFTQESPVIPSGMSFEVSSTSKWFGLARETTYDLRTLKPIPLQGPTQLGAFGLERNLSTRIVGFPGGSEAPLTRSASFLAEKMPESMRHVQPSMLEPWAKPFGK